MTTAGFILIFILVRIFLKDSGQIVYIIYAINLLGLLYVLWQIVSKAYPSIFKEHYQNIPLLEARRKSTIRTISVWEFPSKMKRLAIFSKPDPPYNNCDVCWET